MMRRLLGNWPYKLLAVASAIILTHYVHSQLNPRVTASVNAELEVAHAPKDCVVLAPDRVSLVFEGPKTEVEAVKLAAKPGIDLAGLQTGTHLVRIKMAVPEGLGQNVTIKPAVRAVTVTIEARSSRSMPVEVKIKIPPPIGYASSAPVLTPSTATVSGRSSLVNSVTRLVVMPDLTLLQPSVDEYLPIAALDALGDEVRGIEISPEDAHLAIRLVEASASKTVFVSPTIVGQPQPAYEVTKISVTPDRVIVKGKVATLVGTTTLTTDDVDISGATGDIMRYVSLVVPPGLQTEGVDMVKVTIRIVTRPRT